MKRKTHDEFLKEAKELNKKVTVIGQYINSTTKVLVRCNECGYQYYTIPGVILGGHGCPKCNHSIMITNDEFHQRMKTVNPKIEIIGPYQGRNKRISVKCMICGYEWSPTAQSLLAGHGCPQCVGKARITHEEFVRRMNQSNSRVEVVGTFHSLNVPVLVKCKACGNEWQASPRNLLQGSGCLICSGNYQKTHNDFINEISIKAPNIEVLSEYQNAHTRILVQCKKCGRKWCSTPSRLLHGDGCAQCSGVLKKTHEEFINELAQKNDKIEILSRYINNRTKVHARCKQCNYEWDVTPNSLLRGVSCPKCSGNLKRTNEQFIKELFEVNNQIEPLEPYVNTGTKIRVRCRKCNREWFSTPHSLLQGVGCSRCAGNSRKTHEEFIEELAAKNNNIEILSKYINCYTKVHARCCRCNYEWDAIPSNLLRGSGCPRCARKKQPVNTE